MCLILGVVLPKKTKAPSADYKLLGRVLELILEKRRAPSAELKLVNPNS